ncbi:WD40 repeat protein [Marinilabilia salmonicolor]|jgi:hypothetical protein|uniref:PD40 domain-containing protein n=1 Tax=Marinilabilia salmonicolor TaxID=989 RepID=UPI000D067406|nr:PD40 domain-containing protein [Marinilabilia salmonicolor]PRZ00517.1 WD40 repeat protein [Marinilabilia salmonicolor]
MSRKLYAFFVTTIIIISFFFNNAAAQSTRKIIREANQLIEIAYYDEAIKVLTPLANQDHPEALLLTGFSHLANDHELQKAIASLEKAAALYPLKKNSSNQALEAHFYLGQAYRLNKEPEKACEKFNLVKTHTRSTEFIEDIEQEIAYCENYLKLKETPVDRKVEHLGAIINSPFEDHSPIVLYDESTIYFTSTRPVDSSRIDGPFFENIFASHWRNGQWTTPKVLEIPGYGGTNRATVGLTPDGQGLIFFENFGVEGALFITYKTFEGWTDPEPLPAPINSGFKETHASFSPDGNTIYFSSERPGGLGGKDIYSSGKLPDGTWGMPVNAGETINSPRDEESPFIHPDGKTLYYSSSGKNSMGGYDVFKSTMTEDGKWSTPKNIGYPINTPTDDLFYLPTPNGQRVYYSSQKEQGMGLSDLFVLHFPPENERAMAVVSSHIFNSDNQPAENAVIRVKNLNSQEIMGTFRTNPLTGKFVAIIPTAQEYQLTIECDGHDSYTKTFNLDARDDYKSKNRAIYLPAITLTSNLTVE